MTFPSTARAGQTHKKFGRKYVYSETTEAWTPIVPLASVAEVRKTEASAVGATTVYATAAELPLSNNTTGTIAFVQETDRLYVWSGTGWYNIATIASAGAAISGVNATYNLVIGTPTVITLTQTGLTSPTWSYEVTNSSLGRTATVTQSDNVFNITPSSRARDIGSFGITFKATDGSNTIIKSSQFTLSNIAPVIVTAPQASYALNSDGTPTIITLAATDADGHYITWSHEVLSGSLEDTTVTNVDNVFTITPSVNTNDAGTFQLRFIASDGASFDAEISEFTLSFGPNWTLTTQQAKILASDIEAGDIFGSSVSISGDTVVVGAHGEDTGGTDAGAAYIFTRSGTTWTQQQKIQASDPEANDWFGQSVAISGDTVVVGARYEDTTAADAGAAYIFTKTGTTWTQQQKIQASDAQAGDQFGISVSIDGETVVVGAYAEDTGGADAGSAYVFTRSGTTWTQQQKIQASDLQVSDYFGWSVSISGDTVVVAANREDTGGTDAGAAYIFTRSGTTWTEQAKIQASDAQATDYFGYSVAISGDTVIVGAWKESPGAAAAGSAYIFTRSGTTWTQQAKILASDLERNDSFGDSVAIDVDTVVVGARYEDTGDTSAGAAYIFTRSGTTWTEQSKIQASDAEAQDQFGMTVGIYGDTVVVGAQLEDTGGSNAGAAYVFTRSGTTWTQQTKIQASDAQIASYFGNSVGIYGDTIVVGAHREDTGGNDAGAAYIFTAP